MQAFCVELARSWSRFADRGHALEIGYDFLENVLPGLLQAFNRGRTPADALARGVGMLFSVRYRFARRLWNRKSNSDLPDLRGTISEPGSKRVFTPAKDSNVSFTGQYPVSYLRKAPMNHLPAWHLVGGLDPLQSSDLSGSQPSDGHPVLLRDWIERDGLQCLKIKLRGNDATWDYQRVVGVAAIAIESGVRWLSADFNCTVRDPAYVIEILDRLLNEAPRAYGMLFMSNSHSPMNLRNTALMCMEYPHANLSFWMKARTIGA